MEEKNREGGSRVDRRGRALAVARFISASETVAVTTYNTRDETAKISNYEEGSQRFSDRLIIRKRDCNKFDS